MEESSSGSSPTFSRSPRRRVVAIIDENPKRRNLPEALSPALDLNASKAKRRRSLTEADHTAVSPFSGDLSRYEVRRQVIETQPPSAKGSGMACLAFQDRLRQFVWYPSCSMGCKARTSRHLRTCPGRLEIGRSTRSHGSFQL